MGVELAIASTIIGGMSQADSARSAAKAQERAAKDATGVQKYIFDQTRKDQEPWRQVGVRALGRMEDPNLMRDFTSADFQADPGFDFRMNEGMKAINNAASARGLANSGSTVKAIGRYAQDFASNEYNNVYNRFNANQDKRFNRLAAQAGIGQTATNMVGQAGQNYANSVNQNIMGAGNARSAGAVAQGNAVSNMIGTGVNMYQQNQFMNQLKNLIPQQAPSGFSVANAGGGFGSQMVPGDM